MNRHREERGNAFLDGLVSAEDRAAAMLAGKAAPNGGGYFAEATITRADSLKIEPIDWLWHGWLAAGKLHILAGEAGTGKTTIAMSLAATVSNGGTWPDWTRAKAGNVVIWSGEDGIKDTLLPRLTVCGADLARVHFVGDVTENYERRAFNPARDVEALQRKLFEIGNVSLIVVDPIVLAVSGDSHKNGDVRQGLQPLCDLAERVGAALLGITHFTKGTQGKNPTERVTGSLAFAAAARIVMAAAKRQDAQEGEASRVFCRSKSNIGKDDGGFGYDLKQKEVVPGVEASLVVWGGKIEGSAKELLNDADKSLGDDSGAVGEAMRFLRDLLTENPLTEKEVRECENRIFVRIYSNMT